MKIPRLLFFLLVLFMAKTGVLPAQTSTKNFQFNFKWGFSRDDQTIYDSKTDTLLVTGIDTIMKFKLNMTEQEKQSIREEMEKIDISSYPEKYEYHHPDSVEGFLDSQCQKYFLITTINGNLKKVDWNDCIQSKARDEKHEALMQLDKFIEKIIWSKKPLKDYHPQKMGW